jgi:predicted permease
MFVQVDAGKSGYSRERTAQLMRTLLTKLRDLPEVEAGGVSVHELLDGGSWNQNVTIDNGRRFITDGLVHCNAITSGFFATLGVPIVAGRDFDSREDNQLAPVNRGDPTGGAFTFKVAIINESLARRYFGDRDPIGARIGLGDGPDVQTTAEIIGVVRSFSYRGVRETDDQAFFPFFELPAAGGTFWLRTRASSKTAFPSIRDTVRRLDSGLSIAAMRTVDEALDRSLSNERLLAMLASAFAGLAMLLAVVGVYGTISFVVSHRTREIGIRLALGASRANAMWLILRDASVMLGAGVAIAVPAVWLLGRLVESQLFGVRSMDWPTIGVAATLVTLATFAASALPVGRATAVSPMEALRCD